MTDEDVQQLIRLVREAREAFRPTPRARHVIDIRDWLKAADVALAKLEKP